MKRKAAHFTAALALGLILILAAAGFLAVDLRAEEDMPGEYEPAFRLSGIRPDGAKLSLFGEDYYFLPERLDPAKEALWRYRGLLPDCVQGAAYLTARLIEAGNK